MAVCNLFNRLNKSTGNFLLFSQYVEDITKNNAESDNYKVVPSKFIALDIDYSNNLSNISGSGNYTNLNEAIPNFFQNYYENGCAYIKNNYGSDIPKWTPNNAKYLFWNSLLNAGLINICNYKNSSTTQYVPEIVYYGDINMHSYNEHKGMGYNEIYCYIPTDSERIQCQIVSTDGIENGRTSTTNNSTTLEGYTDKFINGYSKTYYFTEDYSFGFDNDAISKLPNSSDSMYNINTIVVLYSIYGKNGDEWIERYSNIPMGMYITGMFNENNNLTNSITKFVSTNYDTGTSYGLRICTRFAAYSNGIIQSTSDTTADNNYTNLCQLMTAMNENLSKMMDISKSALETTQNYKETLATIKNNRTNVPYVKNINGVDYWFVNGRLVSVVSQTPQTSCTTISEETIRKRISNLSDDNPDNDFEYIPEANECECIEVTQEELLNKLM